MKITIEKTDDLTTVDGAPVRRWKGVTEDGIECAVFVAGIRVGENENLYEFGDELLLRSTPLEATLEERRN